MSALGHELPQSMAATVSAFPRKLPRHSLTGAAAKGHKQTPSSMVFFLCDARHSAATLAEICLFAVASLPAKAAATVDDHRGSCKCDVRFTPESCRAFVRRRGS
jgi:hypothetical protein